MLYWLLQKGIALIEKAVDDMYQPWIGYIIFQSKTVVGDYEEENVIHRRSSCLVTVALKAHMHAGNHVALLNEIPRKRFPNNNSIKHIIQPVNVVNTTQHPTERYDNQI